MPVFTKIEDLNQVKLEPRFRVSYRGIRRAPSDIDAVTIEASKIFKNNGIGI